MTQFDVAMRRQMLRAILVATTAVAALGFGFGALLVVADLAERDDAWDGFGLFLGGILAVPSLAVGVLAVAALRAVRRDLGRARWLSGVAGGLLALPLVMLGAHWVSWLTFALGLALVGSALVVREESSPADR